MYVFVRLSPDYFEQVDRDQVPGVSRETNRQGLSEKEATIDVAVIL